MQAILKLVQVLQSELRTALEALVYYMNRCWNCEQILKQLIYQFLAHCWLQIVELLTALLEMCALILLSWCWLFFCPRWSPCVFFFKSNDNHSYLSDVYCSLFRCFRKWWYPQTILSIVNHPFWGTPIFGNPHIYCLVSFRCFTGFQKLLVGWLLPGTGSKQTLSRARDASICQGPLPDLTCQELWNRSDWELGSLIEIRFEYMMIILLVEVCKLLMLNVVFLLVTSIGYDMCLIADWTFTVYSNIFSYR